MTSGAVPKRAQMSSESARPAAATAAVAKSLTAKAAGSAPSPERITRSTASAVPARLLQMSARKARVIEEEVAIFVSMEPSAGRIHVDVSEAVIWIIVNLDYINQVI